MTYLPDEVSKRVERQEQQFNQQEEFIEERKQLLTELLARTKKAEPSNVVGKLGSKTSSALRTLATNNSIPQIVNIDGDEATAEAIEL